MNASTTLVFQSTQFDIIDRNGAAWLRVHQIGEALGYKQADRALTNLFNSNAEEFTDSMTTLVELDTAVAKEFRRWVLDILDKETAPTFITPDQQNTLQQMVAFKAGNEGGLRAYCWSRFNNHFHLGSYKQLPAAHFDEAVQYLASLPMKKSPALPPPDLNAAFMPPDGRYVVNIENGRASSPTPYRETRA